MHGIECTDHGAQKSYDEMSAEELRRFVEVDGHVGLEEEQEHAARFQKFFRHVAWEPRYALCLSSEEFLKQADRYGMIFEDDFLDYLRGLSFKERRAFDLAMGYVFGKISDLNIHLPKSGLYVLLKASAEPLGPFYNEHRDRQALCAREHTGESGTTISLDRSEVATFDDGWYEPDVIPPVARWMSRQSRVTIYAPGIWKISLDLSTHKPDLPKRPLGLEILVDGRKLCAFSLYRYGWLELQITIPETLRSVVNEKFELEIRADDTWQPAPSGNGADDRELSIAVCNIVVQQ